MRIAQRNYPSVKTLKSISSYPAELRQVLELRTWDEVNALLDADKPFPKSDFEGFKATRSIAKSCYHQPPFTWFKMHMANELCETHGVEGVPAGRNAQSPAFEYLNAGDTYNVTLLYVGGRYRVGCYGDIVERGNYE